MQRITEEAEIHDGASWRRLSYVTWPMRIAMAISETWKRAARLDTELLPH